MEEELRKPHGRQLPTRHKVWPHHQRQQHQQDHEQQVRAMRIPHSNPPNPPTEKKLTALALSEWRAVFSDIEITKYRGDVDENLTEEVVITRANEMSARSEPESEEEK